MSNPMEYPITDLKGVGQKTASVLKKLDLLTIGDLLRHYPRFYEHYPEPIKINQAINGQKAAICVVITKINGVVKKGNLTVLSGEATDNTGVIRFVFFNQPYIRNQIKSGGHYLFYGNVTIKGLQITMEQPAIHGILDYDELVKYPQPIYSLTKGITNKALLKLTSQALEKYPSPAEIFSKQMLEEYDLLDYKSAIRGIHFPDSDDDLLRARRRLVFEEFFFFLLGMRLKKAQLAVLENKCSMPEKKETNRFIRNLPFSLTASQKKVVKEIDSDVNSPICMNRLIQGDVGSGKTIIALIALHQCIENGFQGALMAPTEVLASQHMEGTQKLSEDLNLLFKPILLTGSMTVAQKREAYEKIRTGEANLIIGTHALIQEKVEYHNLGLVVSDEQHRFGVKQREALAGKGKDPHILVMSATPIPRTLALILYGDLQVSIVKEKPADRKAIKNCLVGPSYRATANKFLADKVREGYQAYVICPMVEPGEFDREEFGQSDLENVVEYTDKLSKALPQDIRIRYLHGKLKSQEKNEIMTAFANHEFDILVSTTVIEVGINVPNAVVMLIENAERFGLAQLHQLRGRVGRGDAQSYCIFMSPKMDDKTKERLEIVNQSNDGFHIAQEDLRLRGPGELLGLRQSGEFSFGLGDIYSDADVLTSASEAVDSILKMDPNLSLKEHELIRMAAEDSNRNLIDFRSI